MSRQFMIGRGNCVELSIESIECNEVYPSMQHGGSEERSLYCYWFACYKDKLDTYN